ncbi:uroporphyrinogen-III synthase, partial [Thalassospira xiamenensis]
EIQQQSWDGIVVISKNAALYADALLSQWPRSNWFSVGPSSARVTANYARQPVCCPWREHNSEALLKLPELQRLQNQNWLIIRGEGGRELLADTLSARGARVAHWPVYKRQRRQVDGTALWQNCKAQVRVIMVTSAEQLGYFLAAMPTAASSWLQQCQWLVPSERIAGLIPFANHANIKVTGSATDERMALAIQESFATSTNK